MKLIRSDIESKVFNKRNTINVNITLKTLTLELSKDSTQPKSSAILRLQGNMRSCLHLIAFYCVQLRCTTSGGSAVWHSLETTHGAKGCTSVVTDSTIAGTCCPCTHCPQDAVENQNGLNMGRVGETLYLSSPYLKRKMYCLNGCFMS